MTSINNRNRRGVAWSAIEKFGIQGAQFIVTLVLARMLLPSDYGVIAMLSIFIAVATSLIESGMAQALVQRQNRSEEDLTTALIFNFGVAIAIYTLIYIAAPAIAEFYNVPELCAVARIYSIVLIINSLGVVQQAIITIALDFKRQAMASFAGITLGGCVAIVMAYRGWGVWSLVAQQIVSDTTRTVILWSIAKWYPAGGFSIESLKVLSKFGSRIMFSGLIHVAYVNLYPLIIGRYFATTQLGLFNRATTIGALPSQNISTIVDRALYPVLCATQDDCKVAVETLHRYLRVVCFAVFPAMVGLSVVARPTILLLLGEAWVEAAPLLSIIALAYMWDPIMKFMGSIIKSQGRPDDFMRAEVIKKIVGIITLILAIPFGIEAMAASLILYAFLDMTIVIFYSRRISRELGYWATLRLLAPTIALSAVMGLAVWGITQYTQSMAMSPFAQLLIGVGTGVVSYTLLAYLFKRDELRLLYNSITKW